MTLNQLLSQVTTWVVIGGVGVAGWFVYKNLTAPPPLPTPPPTPPPPVPNVPIIIPLPLDPQRISNAQAIGGLDARMIDLAARVNAIQARLDWWGL